jgi:CheY-like chemotaxis protein
MAHVLALTADLLFGSRLKASLESAGHDVRLVPDEAQLRAALDSGETPAVLLVDLTDADLDGAAIFAALAPRLAATRSLAYYAHVEPAARERARAAGIEMVVPRSRIAREGVELVARLTGTAAGGEQSS